MTMGCSMKTKDILGKYSFTNENITDSLIIKDNIYIHKIFNKDSQLMYQGKDKWILSNDRIDLSGFYNNENNQLEEPLSDEEAKKILMLVSFPVYKKGNNIIIDVNSDENIQYTNVK